MVIFAMEKVFVCLFFNVVKFIHFFLFSIWIVSHHQKASISKPLLQMILESFALLSSSTCKILFSTFISPVHLEFILEYHIKNGYNLYFSK